MRKLAVMQPYFFPYIGYFQLINAVDKFVFYDDVAFINRGWINRNTILINGKPKYITVNMNNASQNRLIKDIKINDNRDKIKKTIWRAYKKAPYFEEAWRVIEPSFNLQTDSISELSIHTVRSVCEYLGLETIFEVASLEYSETKGLGKAERLIEMCKINQVNTYINAVGGKKIYSKNQFSREGIHLFFLESSETTYHQFNNSCIPNLSIIDVMMFNSLETIKQYLQNYQLI